MHAMSTDHGKDNTKKACGFGPCCVVSESLSATLRFERGTRDHGLARTDGIGPVRATLEKFTDMQKFLLILFQYVEYWRDERS